VLVALLINQLGETAVSGLNFNPYLFFGHQTTESSNFEITQTGNIDYQNIKQINEKQSMGIDNIVPIAESALLDDYADTVKGEITFTVDIDPSPMELCYPAEYVIGTITADVYGNYEPYLGCETYWGTQIVTISQTKSSDWNHVKGGECRIEWAWTPDAGCDYDEYIGTIITNEEISLASNQWPDVYGPLDYVDPSGGYGTFPDIQCKKVDFYIETDWSGCRNFAQQGMTFISVQDNYQFPNI
jgi:hypothetical protein